MASVGQRIKDRRIQLGLSVDELAQRLGKNRATVYRYESDAIENLPVTVVGPLAKALQCSPAYLMGWEEDAEATPVYYLDPEAAAAAEFLHKNPRYKVLFDASRKVKPEDIDFVKNLIDRMTPEED